MNYLLISGPISLGHIETRMDFGQDQSAQATLLQLNLCLGCGALGRYFYKM